MAGQRAIELAFELAVEKYAEVGVDVTQALATLVSVPISLHCWQGDDVQGFEDTGQAIGGGLAVTGNYPGKATTADELRSDAEKALSLIPGRHRFNLHASYGEFGERKVDRDQIEVQHFQDWIDWAKEHKLGLDFNPTYFAHPLAADGWTLAHPDPAVRDFWIEHGVRCRRIGAAMGSALATPCITNVWIPDGYKDKPADRLGPRERLAAALDKLFAEHLHSSQIKDAVECKLFGIGSESYVVGSHEFYLGYAISRKKVLCLDAGHFHPTEAISDKISSALLYVDELLLHVSRGVRWDSDHVVTMSNELLAIMQEIVRGNFLSRVHIGLDFFDATINRIAAWVIGTRNTIKALLAALLEPTAALVSAELDRNYTKRLAWQEELRTFPLGAVWDYYCLQNDVPPGTAWLPDVQRYESDVLSKR